MGYYNWDVTDLVRGWYENENTGMMFKMSDSVEAASNVYSQFYSADYSSYQVSEKPTLTIIFRNNNGLEGYWDYTTSSAGRAGTGYVNQYTGNLVWIRDDIGFGGNRMPVTISHIYNANDSTENLFGMGNGWRTNFNQRVYHWDEDTAYGDYYVWEDTDGTDHYFQYESTNTYKDEDGLELTLTIHGSGTSMYYLITDKYGNTSRFDNNGRLVKQENNQATKSSITITYTTSDGFLISLIKDGAGRVYSFSYTNNLLSKIAYKGKGTSEITYVNFGYTNSNLVTVTDVDSKVSRYTYTTNNLMSSAQDIDGYKINYAFTVEAGETYTFSAYVKSGEGNAYLCMSDGSVWPKSEILSAGSNWTRLEVSYTNTTSAAKSVTARFQTSEPGTSYIDCVQVEKAPTASRYNLIQNGDFRTTASWSSTGGRTTVTAANKAPAPQLDVNVYKITGNPQAKIRLSQTIKVSGASGDTFVLAGWAKADSVPIRDTREFALIATFKKGSTTVNTSIVRFNYCADSTINWQYAASPIVANGAYDSIVVELAYDYNANTVYFDGIQLFKEEFGNSYTYDDNGNIISVKDVQSQNTSYQYTNNNLTKQVLPSGAVLTYTYDNYHNVKTAKSSTGVTYNFEYDTYGNNTSVSIVSGSETLSSSAKYTSDGNRLYSTTDAAGNVTTYSYDENTNVLDWVKYPKDTDTTRTDYDYDDMYRLETAEIDVSTDKTLKADYGYTNDLLTSITTGSTTYSFNYGAFALRSNIKIGSRTLASYTYTSRNNFLASLDYGNGDSVDYTYDNQGRVTKQTYEDGDTVTYKYDNNGTLAAVTDSATNITSTYYYDYTDRLLRYAEKKSGYSHVVGYEYDNINNLTALVETINDNEYKTTYNYDDDNRVTSIVSSINGTTGASETYTYDAYSRVSKKVTKNGSTTVLTDTITYRKPTTATTSGQIDTLKSAAASTSGYNVTYKYTYDNNGNIAKVEVGGKATTYTYDSANQLTREDNEAAGKTWVWTYDDAGNILNKKEYAYTTGTPSAVQSTISYSYDATWGDLLTKYNGKDISTDAIGNMLSDGTWTYTWEHGRELMTMSDGSTTWTNTYNADGLRTRRSCSTKTYTYVYNGSSLSQMTVAGFTLYFTYDASGTPMSVKYNDVTYYYATNLQGDVTAILDASGNAVVQYTYDAWGNILSTTGSKASNLGVHNPLRYRGYVYDVETTLYYLQSRYYNPELGRFLNADAFASTGQGILGSNMFAYCLNNPINRIDACGDISLWYYLIIDHDMGFVHRLVQAHIIETYGPNYSAELILTGFGRADIVSIDNGHVWEVKHAGKTPELRAGVAATQAARYIGGTHGNTLITGLGAAGVFEGSFYILCASDYYQVSYTTPQKGAVLYSVKESTGYSGEVYAAYVPQKQKKPARNSLIVGTLGFIAGGGGGFHSAEDIARDMAFTY